MKKVIAVGEIVMIRNSDEPRDFSYKFTMVVDGKVYKYEDTFWFNVRPTLENFGNCRFNEKACDIRGISLEEYLASIKMIKVGENL